MDKKQGLFSRIVDFTSHVLNGFAIIGLTYIVTHDITLQDIASWLN